LISITIIDIILRIFRRGLSHHHHRRRHPHGTR